MRNFNECDLDGEIREEHMFPSGVYSKAQIDEMKKELSEEIQKKADAAETNEALNQKANSSDLIALSSELGRKANLTDLETKLDKAVYDETIPRAEIEKLYM